MRQLLRLIIYISFRLGLLYQVIVARSEDSPLYICIVILLWGFDVCACPACGRDMWEHLTVSLLVWVVFVVCNISFGRKEKHAAKLKFTLDALNADDPFAKQVELADDVLEAINWQSTRTDSEIVAYREALLSTLEQAGDLVLSLVIHVPVKYVLCRRRDVEQWYLLGLVW